MLDFEDMHLLMFDVVKIRKKKFPGDDLLIEQAIVTFKKKKPLIKVTFIPAGQLPDNIDDIFAGIYDIVMNEKLNDILPE